MKNNAPGKAQNQTRNDETILSNTDAAVQRKRLLGAIEAAGASGVTTIQGKEELNILAPAARVHELRHDFDYNIKTIRTIGYTFEGHPHKVARYVMFPGKFDGVRANV